MSLVLTANFSSEKKELYEEIRGLFFSLTSSATDIEFKIPIDKALVYLGKDPTTDILKKLRQQLNSAESPFRLAEKSDDIGHYFIKKVGNKQQYLFSNEGFKMFCMMTKTSKSELVLAHFLTCELEYKRALTQTIEENKKELEMLTNLIRRSEKKISDLVIDNDALLEKVIVTNEYKKIADEFMCIKETNFTFSMFGDADAKIYRGLQNKYMRSLRIYMYDMKEYTKVSEEEAIATMPISSRREFDTLTEYVVQNEYPDEYLYFQVPISTKIEIDHVDSMLLTTFYVLNLEHISLLHQELAPYRITESKTNCIYNISYNELKNTCNNLAASLLHDVKINCS